MQTPSVYTGYLQDFLIQSAESVVNEEPEHFALLIKLQKPDDRCVDYYYTTLQWLYDVCIRKLNSAPERASAIVLPELLHQGWLDWWAHPLGHVYTHWLWRLFCPGSCVCLRSWPPRVDPCSVYRSWRNRSWDSNNWPLWKWTQPQSTLAPDLCFNRLILDWCVVLVILCNFRYFTTEANMFPRTHTHTCVTSVI